MGLTCKPIGKLQGVFRTLENELIKKEKEKAEMEKKRKKEGGETEKSK